jgi:purine nucleosidase
VPVSTHAPSNGGNTRRWWTTALRRTLVSVMAALVASVVCTASAADVYARRKVIIDVDGFGPAGSNLQAILLLLQSPDVEVLGITIPTGDGWRDEEVAHTLRLLEIARRTDVPVYPGAVFPLLNTQARNRSWEAQYGRLFFKGAWTEVWPDEGAVRYTAYHADPYLIPPSPAGQPTIRAARTSAADFLSRAVHDAPGEVTIVAVGPLTDLALAARLDPAFASLAKELVFLGGSFNPVAADNAFAAEYVNSPRREFNMRWDPEAASIVLHEPWKKITEIPIDPTTRTLFKPEFIQAVASGRAPFAAYIGRYAQPYPMWDELTVAVWLNPAIATRTMTLLVDVDTSFTAGYGDTLSWPVGAGPELGERPVNVVFDVDVPQLERMTLALLMAPTPSQ